MRFPTSPSENNLLEWGFFNVGWKHHIFSERVASTLKHTYSNKFPSLTSYFCTGLFTLAVLCCNMFHSAIPS